MYKYTSFIPENIAPTGAKKIGVYNASGEKVCTIPLGGLAPSSDEKLYSFGLLSDTHIYPIATVDWTPEVKLSNALNYFKNQGCAFVAICGDLTQTGFTLDDVSAGLDTRQFAKYKEICDANSIPVYGVCGNHESITNKNAYAIKNQRDLLVEYTGNDMYYMIERGNDLFIFIGQPNWNEVMDDEEFQWLTNILESNTTKRCFIFIHAYIEEDSGDPLDYRENSIFENWGVTKTKAFMNLMSQNKNVILFHGHSHTKYECQQYDKTANYTERNGFKSVHVPSLSMPRYLDLEAEKTVEDHQGSQGCIVDVYNDYIVLRGQDLIHGTPEILGTFKIKTSPQ